MHDIRIDALQLLDELAVGVRVVPGLPTTRTSPGSLPVPLKTTGHKATASERRLSESRESQSSDSLRRISDTGAPTRGQPEANPRLSQRLGPVQGANVPVNLDVTASSLPASGADTRIVKVVPFSRLFTRRHAIDGSANAVIVVLEMYARQCAWVSGKSPKAGPP